MNINFFSGSNPGKTVYTCMLNKKGGIEADLTVSALDEQGWDGNSPLYPVSVTLLPKRNTNRHIWLGINA